MHEYLNKCNFFVEKNVDRKQMAGALYNLALSYTHDLRHKFCPTVQHVEFQIFLPVASRVDFPSQLHPLLLRQES